jgi:heme-degrading monooxygenase HmoA
MYGTIARMRAKPGGEAAFVEEMRRQEQGEGIPGLVTSYIYRMDADSNEYYLVVLFTDKAAYVANANSPEQDQRYQRMLATLDGPPEWHDGEIIFGGSPGK